MAKAPGTEESRLGIRRGTFRMAGCGYAAFYDEGQLGRLPALEAGPYYLWYNRSTGHIAAKAICNERLTDAESWQSPVECT